MRPAKRIAWTDCVVAEERANNEHNKFQKVGKEKEQFFCCAYLLCMLYNEFNLDKKISESSELVFLRREKKKTQNDTKYKKIMNSILFCYLILPLL